MMSRFLSGISTEVVAAAARHAEAAAIPALI